MNRRVCLFGLSADPPTGHGGHVGIVRALRTTFDDIRVLPVYRHTFRVRRLEGKDFRCTPIRVGDMCISVLKFGMSFVLGKAAANGILRASNQHVPSSI
jgi:hypothetical protein